MKRLTMVLACAVVAACAGETANEEPEPLPVPGDNELSAAEQEGGWELLFDGATTAGWRSFGEESLATDRWIVEDGTLTSIAPQEEGAMVGADIVTTRSYTDFDLRFEFNVTPVGNSGVFYRVLENGEPIWWNAPEYQVLDDATYMADGLDAKHLSGANYDLHFSELRVVRPPGEWNQGRILVEAGHVEHWLNGEKLVEYELGSPEWEALVAESKFNEYPNYGTAESGPIGLQDHGHRVSYRNIKIKRLDGAR